MTRCTNFSRESLKRKPMVNNPKMGKKIKKLLKNILKILRFITDDPKQEIPYESLPGSREWTEAQVTECGLGNVFWIDAEGE